MHFSVFRKIGANESILNHARTEGPARNRIKSSREEDMHACKDEPEPLMTREAAARYLGLSPGTLAVWACTGRYDLRPLKVGRRCVRYRRAELDRFLEGWMPTRPE